MIYDLGQIIFNNVPQWPKVDPTSTTVPRLTAAESATVERLELMAPTGTHVHAPFHFFSDAEAVDALPRSHLHAPRVAFALRHTEAGGGITASDLRRHSEWIGTRIVVLLKTGWGENRALTKEFPTAWPYLSGEAVQHLVSRSVHGFGIEGLSIGGFDDPEQETASHRALLGAKKLVIEDIRMREALLERKVRHFAAFPVLIEKASGVWTRATAWDEGEMA